MFLCFLTSCSFCAFNLSNKINFSQHLVYPQRKMSKPQILQLTPQTELSFDGPFTEVVTTYLTLGNPTSQIVYFKVKTTAPRYYCVRPNSGIIQPNGNAKISVMLQPVDQPATLDKDRTRHKFMIQSAVARSDDSPVDEFWKSIDPSEIMDSKLKVVFHNLNLNGAGGSDAGSRSNEGSVYHEDTSQSHQQQNQRRPQQTSHDTRRASPTETGDSGHKERRLEEENRSLTMQVQELRHKLNTFSNSLTQQDAGLPLIQVALLALAAVLVGIILGKLF
ncbi:Major sperm protein [Aphelenchoides bicaudatus]|nr:Major sperm protein [Aphelenchoides bicaudatus]